MLLCFWEHLRFVSSFLVLCEQFFSRICVYILLHFGVEIIALRVEEWMFGTECK